MAKPPPTQPSLRIVYEQPFKGSTYTPSNRFYLSRSAPSTESKWHALADDLVLHFKTCIGDFSHITLVECTEPGSSVPVHTYTYSTAGTQTVPAGGMRLPGYSAQLLKWTTTQRTTKNHPIYLFNYVHALYNYPGTPDASSQRGNIITFAQRLAASGAGLSDGTDTYFKAGPYGAVAQTAVSELYTTVHDLFT